MPLVECRTVRVCRNDSAIATNFQVLSMIFRPSILESSRLSILSRINLSAILFLATKTCFFFYCSFSSWVQYLVWDWGLYNKGAAHRCRQSMVSFKPNDRSIFFFFAPILIEIFSHGRLSIGHYKQTKIFLLWKQKRFVRCKLWLSHTIITLLVLIRFHWMSFSLRIVARLWLRVYCWLA